MKYNNDGSLRVSPSELKCADTCLRKYFFEYLLGVKLPQKYKPPFALGTLMHRAAEMTFGKKTYEVGELSTLAFARKQLQEKVGPDLWVTNEDFDIDQTLYWGRAEHLFDKLKRKLETVEIVEIEEHMSTMFDKWHMLHGYVDVSYKQQVGDSKVICFADYKFGDKIKTERDLTDFWYQWVGYKKMIDEKYDTSCKAIMLTGAVSQAAKPKDGEVAKFGEIEVNLAYNKQLVTDLHDRIKVLVELVLNNSDRAADRKALAARYAQTGRSQGNCSWCVYNDICNGEIDMNVLLGKDELIDSVNAVEVRDTD